MVLKWSYAEKLMCMPNKLLPGYSLAASAKVEPARRFRRKSSMLFTESGTSIESSRRRGSLHRQSCIRHAP